MISEAAARRPDALKSLHPEIPRPQLVAFRNILVHAYFGTGWDGVWRAAGKRCPILREQVAKIIASPGRTRESK
jgi:uncharacterized protein with HEPN domain